jgi:hypothetical protein
LKKGGQRVLFIFGYVKIYYDGQGGIFEVSQLPLVTDHDFWSKDLWCLFDAKYRNDFIGVPVEQCSFILSTSPKRSLYKDFVNEMPTPRMFYMPIWKEEEMKSLSIGCFPNIVGGVWKERYDILGGVPRFVLQKTVIDATILVVKACSKCAVETLHNVVGENSTVDENSKFAHTLVHINSVRPYSEIEMTVYFASGTVMDIIVRVKNLREKLKMEKLVAVKCRKATHCCFVWVYI